MHASDLVRMANQIAEYFGTYPKCESIDGIAKHIHAFWDPRMRDELKAHMDAGGAGLSPLLSEALTIYFKGPLAPKPAKVSSHSKTPKGAEPSLAPGGGDG
ncbi:MAG: formate dehydrogenase subunit delta [Hyphomicrobium sp.]|nr:formate dehydrogenase subunit delta [Hyphomicrobium sp.]